MALRWVIHSACHALGYQSGSDQVVSYPSSGGGDHQVKSFNASPNNNIKGTSTSTVSYKEEKNNTRAIQSDFQMPLHYPRYTKADYENMEEWKLDLLLNQYGIHNIDGSLDYKRAFSMGTFLWPDQY
ncbi:hypothetical protein FNV43_RR07963 [Rhamnella rubrinervis]|uniref:DUF7722 domain-containing protein n=1 Tax=Rhamnella rubrinervis TaxID=2594499 RepID=A0A8K0MMU5_9ROSA|nr:hypothetical protein FNV43_RR07963 [Rhamnella rubrinervis]